MEQELLLVMPAWYYYGGNNGLVGIMGWWLNGWLSGLSVCMSVGFQFLLPLGPEELG